MAPAYLTPAKPISSYLPKRQPDTVTKARFVEKDGTTTDIRFRSKRAARHAARLVNESPQCQAAFILDDPSIPMGPNGNVRID